VNHAKIREWLNKRGITLEESFSMALERYIENYKKSGMSLGGMFTTSTKHLAR